MKYVGQPVKGLTNELLVRGKGTYVSDIQLPGMTYMAVLRSPYPHARIRSVDVRRAQELPGVVMVATGKDLAASTEPIPSSWDPKEMGAKEVKWYALCPDRVRYVGEAVAAVVAEDKFTAYAALQLIDVDFEELPYVTDPEAAMQKGAPLVEPEWGDNILVSRDFTVGDPDEQFAKADHVLTGTVQSNRITGTPLEPRGCLANWDPFRKKLTFWDSTQDPHPLRTFMAFTLRIPENQVQVIQPHVGGGFGLKQPTFQEEPLTAWLSIKLGRPVKWIEERYENFIVGGHARDTRFQYKVAFNSDGTLTALELKVIADVGAPTALCGYGMSFVTWYCIPTVYRIRNVRMQLHSVVTNKCPWNSYRGYGKDAATFVMERVVDRVAKTLKRDRADIRFQNFIQPDEFPWSQPSGAMLDSGNYPATLQQVLDMVDYKGFREYQAKARAAGRRVGLGLSMELTPEGASVPGSLIIGGFDGSTVRVAPTGDVTVLTGVTSPGSGNETAMAQIAADALGCMIERVQVMQGDTDLCPWGLGNYSSRSVILGGSAVHEAATIIRNRMLAVAGRMLEAPAEDLDAEGGRIFMRGNPDRGLDFEEVVAQFYKHPHGANMDDIEPALESTRHFKIGNVYHQPEKQGRLSTYPTWPYAAAAAIVEVDPENGMLTIQRYCYAHDSGKIINPMLAEANLHGGITQGIGGAIYEFITYDASGQPRTSTFMDYTIPTAVEAPNYEIGHLETPSPHTPLGTKGVGESGVGAALNALCSAIEDALPELPLEVSSLPLTPARVWKMIQEAESARSAPIASDARPAR
ncbi:MAG: xanthine dehydrogenase family protein molybdopterin-binding subunit [Candidatus Dormibacteria bacterium]